MINYYVYYGKELVRIIVTVLCLTLLDGVILLLISFVNKSKQIKFQKYQGKVKNFL